MDLSSALANAGISLVAGTIASLVTTRLQLQQQRAAWRRELTLKLAEANSKDKNHAQNLAKQFALGVLIREGYGERERYFIAPNSRITVGRAPDNEIVVEAASFSHKHFAVCSDESNVFVEDLGSTIGTFVDDQMVNGRQRLESQQRIGVGDGISFEFQKLKTEG